MGAPAPMQPVSSPLEPAHRGASITDQALDAQAALLPYALAAFGVSLPIYVWAGSHAANSVWMSGSFAIFAAAWAAFYAAVLDADVEGGDPFARVTVPGAVLSFFATRGMESMVPGSMAAAVKGGFTLEFQVADVDACHERLLARGVEVLKPPTTQP